MACRAVFQYANRSESTQLKRKADFTTASPKAENPAAFTAATSRIGTVIQRIAPLKPLVPF